LEGTTHGSQIMGCTMRQPFISANGCSQHKNDGVTAPLGSIISSTDALIALEELPQQQQRQQVATRLTASGEDYSPTGR